MDEKNDFLNAYKKKITNQQPDANQPDQAADGSPAIPAVPAGDSEQTRPVDLHFEAKSEFVPVRPPETSGRIYRRKPRRLVWIAWVVVLAAALAAAGLFWHFSRFIEMPDLAGWAVTDAQLWARENNIQLQIDEQYNDQYDADKIAAQGIAAGTRVKKGIFLPVVVSLGHDLTVELELPDLMNMTKEQIDAWIAANFMSKVRITAEYSSSVASGRVIRYEINDNTVVDKVKRNTPIYVILSKGPEELVIVKVTVPNFKEKTVAQSYEFANENGLTLVVAEAYDDYAPDGQIIGQSVKADEEVDKGTEITITVSLGKKILVPDFSMLTKSKASAVAADLGMTVTAAEKYSDKAAGSFLSQSLAAGSVYAGGDVLELTYSLGNQITIASFVGQPREAILNWANGLNEQGAAITVKTTYTQSNSPKDVILQQSKASTTIGSTATIYITVSRGKALFVPDFVAPEGAGYDTAILREQALALCNELNIIPVFVAENKTGRLPGEIWYQSVAAGKEVFEGNTITLKYCPANVTLTIPDFTGQTRQAILAAGWMSKLNMAFADAETPKPDAAGQVCRQSVAAGTTVAAGTEIILTIYPAG